MDVTRGAPRAILAAALIFSAAAVRAELPLGSPLRTVAEARAEPPPIEKPDRNAQRAEIADRLRVAQRELARQESTDDKAADPGKAGGPASKKLGQEVDGLKQLDVILAQQQSAEQLHREAEARLADLEQQVETERSRAPAELEPVSFPELDHLRDELQAERDREQAVADKLDEVTSALDRAREAYLEMERRRRSAKEALGTSKNASDLPALAEAFERAEQASRVADETVQLRETERLTEKVAEQTYRQRIALLELKIARAADNVTFAREDLEEELLEIDSLELELKRTLQTAETSGQFLDQQWFDARRRLDADAEKPPALVAEVEARRLARLVQQQQVSVLGDRLGRLAARRQAWQHRFELASDGLDRDTTAAWVKETRVALEQLQRDYRLQQIRIDEVRKDLATVESKIEASGDASPDLSRWLVEQRRRNQDLMQVYERNLVSVETSRRLLEKLLTESTSDSLATSAREGLDWVKRTTRTVWNYEIAAVDDRPITVRKIVTGLVLLLIGWLAARIFSVLFGRRFLPRLGVNAPAAAALQTVVFYTLVVLIVLFALRVVNVPLTVFTVAGGALALGVGFGSQNVINNFISGLILLAERPVKVGDLVEVDELYGTVEKIGARSTRVRTGNNLEVVVPNSTFLQNNVINFTLSDDRLRTTVTVGVIYGSATDEVTRLLRLAVDEHPKALKTPEPIILFTEFGDNALIFEVHFWLRMRTMMERLKLESELRYRIDNLFREAGLVIAFPQRDVHLNGVGPVEVRLLSDDNRRVPAPGPTEEAS